MEGRNIETKEQVRAFLNEICDLIIDNLVHIENTRYEFSVKNDGSLVTRSDIYVEKLVFQYVTRRLGDVLCIGEESFDSKNGTSDQYIVLLDPIDGTENFCSGMKEWGVSFGLWKGSSHLGSFLLLPELGIRLVTGDHVKPLQSRITGVSSAMSDEILDLLKNKGEYRITGCAVYNIYCVIKGSFYRFINPKGAYIWDVLPGMMLALEQGCKVTVDNEPFTGQFLNPDKKYRIIIQR